MNAHAFRLSGTSLHALPSGALLVPDHDLLCVSDLHLGKSDRIARRGGALLPPYETRATLEKLAAAIAATDAHTVVCLGDSFDDLDAADSLTEDERLWLVSLQAGRRWIWIEGNHDPGPITLGGSHCASYHTGALTFRHIADPLAGGEVSGHYHPKFGPPGRAGRPAFLYDSNRVILPAFGAYTGGLRADRPVIAGLMRPGAVAVMTGHQAIALPLSPR
jgi:DNA ligase-associated metallophosphoesterase